MYRKVLAVGVTTAAIVGAGGVALATTGSTTAGQPAGPSSTSSAKPGSTGDHQGKGGGKLLKHMLHAQIVTKGKKGSGVVTHDLIKGTVTSVSATSITVESEDKKSETFIIGKDTKVVTKAKGAKPVPATISKVVKGQHVLVEGTGTPKLTAEHVVDVGTK